MNARHGAPRTQRERQRQFFSHDGTDPGRHPVTGGQGGDAGERGEWEDE
jgi:hypothetical protein